MPQCGADDGVRKLGRWATWVFMVVAALAGVIHAADAPAPPATASAGTPGGTVRIGGVDMSADCPLARREHPRLLFTRADLPRLRARLQHPRLAAELDHARQVAAQGRASAILLGVLYHLTGEEPYLRQAQAKLEPSWIQTYPLAADLVMAALSPAEQQAEAQRLVQVIQRERWRPHLVLDLAAWGHGQDEFLDQDLQQRYRADLVDGIAYNNRWSQGRGGSSMSHGYYGEHFYSEWFTLAVAWSHATGQDWISRCDFAAHTPEYYAFHYRPWTPRPEVVHIGVNAMCDHWEAVTPAKFEGENLAVLAATRFHDGLGQWWVDQVISRIPMGWDAKTAGDGGIWGKLLWYDPDLPVVAPAQLPPARLFPENGHAIMRSDWTPQATYALFRCGRFGEIDGTWGRNNADNLHFIIDRGGVLAADTGAVHSLNNAALAFAGAQVHSDALPHITEYARQTIAHNSLLVGREPLVLRGWDGKPLATVRAGGQSPIQDKSWWEMWGLPRPAGDERAFKDGQIVAYETSPVFDYVAGDATHSYPPTRVRSITRQFVYLRPDTFVVFDRVRLADRRLPVTWLLHSLYRPTWNGATAPEAGLPAAEQQVLAPDGQSLQPNPQPGGRYVHRGGDTFVFDDQWPGMTGRLFARILWPQENARTVRTVGGAWHEFEVEGINYGPTAETYRQHQGTTSPQNRLNTIGLEGWRIELSPQAQTEAVNFLVVLLATDQKTSRMPPAELVEADSRKGARIVVGARTYEVAFALTGPLGGHITVMEGGRTVVERDLAGNVQDHYQQWSADLRYAAWTTRPEYRNFIGAGDGIPLRR